MNEHKKIIKRKIEKKELNIKDTRKWILYDKDITQQYNEQKEPNENNQQFLMLVTTWKCFIHLWTNNLHTIFV